MVTIRQVSMPNVRKFVIVAVKRRHLQQHEATIVTHKSLQSNQIRKVDAFPSAAFSIRDLWHMTLNHDLKSWPTQDQDEPLYRISISFESYCPNSGHTDTRTRHTTVRLLYTASKVVSITRSSYLKEERNFFSSQISLCCLLDSRQFVVRWLHLVQMLPGVGVLCLWRKKSNSTIAMATDSRKSVIFYVA